ncbi:nucleoside hydrolase [Herbiconiux sp. CPCC 205716]|uniref:Nucleoside hydrolase n=1 Tax=Herbiconiux gentiana TaxID=2970912 RepID=A0ABT2GEV3_9MICO|nr:nucleoside hydrolase [Herbiconiux gentiana]MCS5714167.1 nucleoside hydrolase [Herbiconiux gentiana]
MTIPLIIDTDTAQDDAIALLFGLLDPAADLRAITIVAGNVGFEQQVANALLTVAAAGRSDERLVHRGCVRPMMREWTSAEGVHGDGIGGLVGPEDAVNGRVGEVSDEHAVDALIRLCAEAPGEVTVVAIGPLTNIATAVVKDRSFPATVKSLVIMGGSNNGRGNTTPSAEFNFYADPEAARIVFEAGFDDVLVLPWEPVTVRDGILTRTEYESITSTGAPLQAFFRAACDKTLEVCEAVGLAGSTHPDSMTVAAVLHEDLMRRTGRYRVEIETASALTLGHSVMAWPKFGLAANARVIEEVDHGRYLDLLGDLLATPGLPTLEEISNNASRGG